MESGEHGLHGLHVEWIVRRPELEIVIILPHRMEAEIVLEQEQLVLIALEGTVKAKVNILLFQKKQKYFF